MKTLANGPGDCVILVPVKVSVVGPKKLVQPVCVIEEEVGYWCSVTWIVVV